MRCPPTKIAGWRLTRHAEARAAERGFDEAELLAALEQPEVSYTQPMSARSANTAGSLSSWPR